MEVPAPEGAGESREDPPVPPSRAPGAPVSRRRPRVVVLDYGSGNLRSAQRALQRVGADAEITSGSAAALQADGLVVPGVGAFAACMAGLTAVGGETVIGKRLAGSRPVLGICVGMQVLFEAGVEHGQRTEGCGCWPGVVQRLAAPVLPHMGWNTVSAPAGSRAAGRDRTPASCSTSSTPTRPRRCRRDPASRARRWSPGPGTARTSSRPPRTEPCARPSSTRRSPATWARCCSATGWRCCDDRH